MYNSRWSREKYEWEKDYYWFSITRRSHWNTMDISSSQNPLFHPCRASTKRPSTAGNLYHDRVTCFTWWQADSSQWHLKAARSLGLIFLCAMLVRSSYLLSLIFRLLLKVCLASTTTQWQNPKRKLLFIPEWSRRPFDVNRIHSKWSSTLNGLTKRVHLGLIMAKSTNGKA